MSNPHERGVGLVEPVDLTCRELVELVTDYLEGVLPAAERLRFEAHLAECPYCQTYLAQMRRTIALVGKLSESTIDPIVERELLQRFRAWKQR
jgi:anti-sigma factor RsiW